MSFRADGSFNSTNNPIESNRYMVFDYGMYKAQISKVMYIDSPQNNSNVDQGPEVQYEVRIIGGQRDGQIFSNAVDMQLYGGISNYSERGWKAVSTITNADPANVLNPSIEPPKKLNGDVVYIQFINGDIHYPVILGGAKHASNIIEGATTSDHQKYSTSFNGISTEIDKDGVFTWIKAKGLYSATPLVNSESQTLWDQFIPIVGMEEAVSVTINNDLLLRLAVNPVADQGISVEIDGLNDSFAVTTALSDSLRLSSTDGFSIRLANGAQLTLHPTSFVSLGNSSDDAMLILKALIQSLSTATYAGFGASGSNVADLVTLLTRITTVTG